MKICEQCGHDEASPACVCLSCVECGGEAFEYSFCSDLCRDAHACRREFAEWDEREAHAEMIDALLRDAAIAAMIPRRYLLAVDMRERCQVCDGHGSIDNQNGWGRCNPCDGTGFVSPDVAVEQVFQQDDP